MRERRLSAWKCDPPDYLTRPANRWRRTRVLSRTLSLGGFKLKTRRDTKMCAAARDKKKKVSSPREDKRKVRRKRTSKVFRRARASQKKENASRAACESGVALFSRRRERQRRRRWGTTTKTRRKRKRTFCQNDGRSTEREEASRIEGAVCISRTPARTRFAETLHRRVPQPPDGTAGNRDEAVIRIDRHNEDAVVEEDGLRSRV